MRFLVDTNLPPALAVLLAAEGFDAQHTSNVGLEKARDRDIWLYAASNGYCIVTKDEDFVLLKAAKPDGPSVVWVRIGNAVRRVIVQRVSAAWPAVVDSLRAGNGVIEIR